MTHGILAFLGVLLLAHAVWPGGALADGKRQFDGLKPGEFVVHELRVPVRMVLIGFAEGQVNEDDLRGVLPATYKPVVRGPEFYGLHGRDLGLQYRFEYRIIRKNRRFTDSFFRHLKQIGTEGPLTAFQHLYNDQATNVLDVVPPVLYIDARKVERWLEERDDHERREYTIYFVNWHGRDDFRFHVYTKTDEPDPDTGFNFGRDDFGPISSWGGSSSRNWFYDFSAGPEWNTANWYVDAEDFGDGVVQYRMPTIWEYAAGGYRSPDRLGHDMGLLARFVAINLLFTSSPLYDPLVTAPGPHGRKVVHLTMFEDDPASKGQDFLDLAYAGARWAGFQPYYRWKVGLGVVDPIDAGANRAFDIAWGHLLEDDCWNAYGYPLAELFCYFDAHLPDYVPAYGPRDYVGEVFGFNTTQRFDFNGFADDNWVDGTQTYSFVFGADWFREFGYGFTWVTVHEVGHHIGLSHPHDGYDSELGIDYSPVDDFFFVWEGDESDTVMSYLNLAHAFGHHNSDNMYRWEAAGYLNWANALAGAIVVSPEASRAGHALARADEEAKDALAALGDWRYLRAADDARDAYAILAKAAEQIGVTAPMLERRMQVPEMRFPKRGCIPRRLEELVGRRPGPPLSPEAAATLLNFGQNRR
jgi:hypothetical protein